MVVDAVIALPMPMVVPAHVTAVIPLAAVVEVVLAVSLFASNSLAAIATDLLVALVIIYAVQGLAIVHAIAFAVGRPLAWLMVLVYALLAILPPFVVVALAGMGFADSWLNFRAYFDPKKPNVSDK